MRKRFGIFIVCALVSCATVSGFAAEPTMEAFKQAFTARLMKLKPEEMLERQVVIQQVRAGSAGNFRVTAFVRDYGTGYPKNRYYGMTCIGRFEDQDFTLAPDGFGGWNVSGMMTPSLDK